MNNSKNIILAILLVALLFLGYAYMTTPEQRTLGEKVDDAVSELDNGVDNAARELQDRTPAEKIEDNIKDATDSTGP